MYPLGNEVNLCVKVSETPYSLTIHQKMITFQSISLFAVHTVKNSHFSKLFKPGTFQEKL